MSNWVRVANEHVRHVWVKDGCCSEILSTEFPDGVAVSPDYYEVNGEPLCACDAPLTFSHTEVQVPENQLSREILATMRRKR